MVHIAIVGGGFAGAVSVLWLLRSCPDGTAITVLEPAETLGRGTAYQKGPDHFLLNVPARYISPIPGDPEHFLRWLIGNRISDLFRFIEPDGAFFVPRSWFGDYMESLLVAATRRRAGSVRFVHRRETVRAIAPGNPIRIITDGGYIAADHLVLAPGNAPPRQLRVRDDVACRVVQSAWMLAKEPPFPPDRRVAIVGAGLTMADVVSDLERRGHTGPIAVVSRHGRMPHVSGGHLPEYTLPDEPIAATARGLLRQVRRWADEAMRSEIRDWRPVIDMLRQQAPAFWRSLPASEQARFRRHLRHMWEIHRYPMPPATSRAVGRRIASGGLVHWKGVAVDVRGAGLYIRHGDRERLLPADIVINATGPDRTYQTSLSGGLPPLFGAMGIDCAHAEQAGMRIDDDGMLLGCVEPFAGRVWCNGNIARERFGELGTVPAIADIAQRSAIRIFGGVDAVAGDKRAGVTA